MFQYIYKKLINNKARPFLLSKINLWNILNRKFCNITTPAILFFTQKPTSLVVRTVGILREGFFSIKVYTLAPTLLILLTLLCAFI